MQQSVFIFFVIYHSYKATHLLFVYNSIADTTERLSIFLVRKREFHKFETLLSPPRTHVHKQ